MAQRVFVDANVLFSRTLYDWLFLLRIESRGRLFQIHTSWDVINEAGTRLRDDHPEWDGEGISSLMSKIQDIFDEIIEVFPGAKSTVWQIPETGMFTMRQKQAVQIFYLHRTLDFLLIWRFMMFTPATSFLWRSKNLIHKPSKKLSSSKLRIGRNVTASNFRKHCATLTALNSLR